MKAQRSEPEELELSSQPGALTAGRLAIEEPRLYKAGMHLELQKFGSPTRLSLLDTQPEPVQITGLDLTVSQSKALSALQILLARTGHQGNRPGQPARSDGYQGQQVPRLAMTYSDFFEAYGLDRATGGWTKQHQEALEALHDLAEPRWRIAYKRRRWTGAGKQRREVFDVIAPERPVSLLTILKAYKGLEEAEVARLEQGESLPGRESGLVVDCHPILIDQIQTFFTLKPEDLHQEIQALSPGKRVSRTISHFIELLLTVDIATWQVSEDTLLEKLRLYKSFYQQRNKSRIRKQLQQAFAAAQELGYLLEWQQDPAGRLTFILNPARCSRVRQKQTRQKQLKPGGGHGEP